MLAQAYITAPLRVSARRNETQGISEFIMEARAKRQAAKAGAKAPSAGATGLSALVADMRLGVCAHGGYRLPSQQVRNRTFAPASSSESARVT
jgi:hypothetical protein